MENGTEWKSKLIRFRVHFPSNNFSLKLSAHTK